MTEVVSLLVKYITPDGRLTREGFALFTSLARTISGGAVSWGDIDGAIGDQTDLQTALNGKSPASHNHSYPTLDDLPTLGTAAAADVGDFASAAQGALAGTALQPDDMGLSGVATITVPGWRRLHVETIAAPGITALDRITASLGAMGPTDPNTAELLEIAALSAVAGADQITFTAAFAVPASGPIPLNWSAF